MAQDRPPDPNLPAAPPSPGPALERSDADLDELAQVTNADIQDARNFWHEHAAEKFKGLIDAATAAKLTTAASGVRGKP